jgi:ABC-type proline/glycine betaine transport system ATPase subunit
MRDDMPPPQSSYGVQKVISELLIDDYTRRDAAVAVVDAAGISAKSAQLRRKRKVLPVRDCSIEKVTPEGNIFVLMSLDGCMRGDLHRRTPCARVSFT